MKFEDKVYNILKWVALILLPAINASYLALTEIWNAHYDVRIVATIAAINTFLGVILGISTQQYNRIDISDGTLNIDRSSNPKEPDKYELDIKTSLDIIPDKDYIKLKVNSKAYIDSQDEQGL